MKTWAGYAEEGRAALLTRDYETLNRLIDANFDLRAKLYNLSPGNLEMIEAARNAGATANFAGSGGAITGCYSNEATYEAIKQKMRLLGVAVVKPIVA
jgi:glucuronokinase